MKPMLVLVTSERCGACKAFKSKIWPRLGTYLKRDPRFDVTEVHVMSNSNEIRKIHTDLIRFVGWFPTIIMFTGASWVSTSLTGTVLNGEFIDGKITHYQRIPSKIKQMLLLEHKAIYNWIEDVLERPEFHSERPKVVITDESRSLARSTDDVSTRVSRSMYDSTTEFVENDDEYI